jgi:stage II sporulation protein M
MIKSFLIENYKKCWDYLKVSRNFIYAIGIVFLIFVLVGFFIPASDQTEKLILEFVKDLIEKTQNMSQRELSIFIFLNNLQSSFFGMVFGIIFGIFSLFMILVNGYLLGFIALMSVRSQGVLSLWRIFPHGIFELPAVFISLGLGLKLGTFIFQKKKLRSLRLYFYNSLRVFLFIVLPLLVVAAIIEGALISLIK